MIVLFLNEKLYSNMFKPGQLMSFKIQSKFNQTKVGSWTLPDYYRSRYTKNSTSSITTTPGSIPCQMSQLIYRLP